MTLIKLKVHPASKSSALERRSGDAFEAWVRSPAENGLANKEALGLLARSLNVSAKRLRIVKGAASPNKIVKLWE